MDIPSQPSRVLPVVVGIVVVLGVAGIAGTLFFKHDTPMVEPDPVSQPDSPPNRLWQPDGRTRGDLNAPVTLIEYSDFTCDYCVKFFRETWPRLSAKYVETGKVRLLYRDYPRDPEGPAMTAAIAARCAGDQGRYWQMHDRLFASTIHIETIEAHAKAIGMDQPAFLQCLRDAPHRQAIFQDKQDGMRLGFVGTPGFLLMRTQAGDEKPIGLPGAFSADVFEKEIERLLKPPSETKNKG